MHFLKFLFKIKMEFQEVEKNMEGEKENFSKINSTPRYKLLVRMLSSNIHIVFHS
jgi:hypothetical protein